MRNEKEMMTLILNTAQEDTRIRAVLMNGSRTNSNAPKDIFQDYDIVYLVTEIQSFMFDHNWVDRFGRRIMMQMPEDKILPPAQKDGSFTYLLLFEDGTRIDLWLVPVNLANKLILPDSLMKVLLDKDGIIGVLPSASDRDYWVGTPSCKEFADCCNGFWWSCTNIAKGLWREELPYAKHMTECAREMLDMMVAWQVGIQNNFSVSVGKFNKYIRRFLSAEQWETYKATYSDASIENNWTSLFIMCSLFREAARKVSDLFCFSYPSAEDLKVTQYLHKIKNLPSDAEDM